MRANDAAFRAEAAAAIAALAPGAAPAVLLGFDGFVDSIIDAVATRTGPDDYAPMATLADLGGHISAAAGKSCNVELVVRQQKIGGNAAIMANAMAALEHPVDFVGTVGEGAVHPAFAPLAERAREVISLGAPAMTDAVEFTDGKVMFGKLTALDAITADNLRAALGEDGLKQRLRAAGCVGTVNWTMTLGMTGIWRHLIDAVLPGLRDDRPPWFVDLADPAKRSAEDLAAALAALQELQRFADVILSVNEREARQVLEAAGGTYPADDDELVAATAAADAIRATLGIDRVVVHLVPSAAAAGPAGTGASVGFSTPKPLITTGGGDHFNAGYLGALSRGLDDETALLVGNAVSGFYVRSGQSPSWAEIVDFLLAWED